MSAPKPEAVCRRFRWGAVCLLAVLAALLVTLPALSQTDSDPAHGTGLGTATGTGSAATEPPAPAAAVPETDSRAIRFAEELALNPEASPLPGHLRVATKPFAPFVFEEDGVFTGFSIELWDLVAQELGVTYEWVGTTTVSELLDTVRHGTADVAIAGITITASREQTLDFTQPFFQSGLQVLVSSGGGVGGGVLGVIFSPQFLRLVGLLLLVLFAAANVLWVLERKKNPHMFPPSYFKGIWEAFWWSAVTATTVGYGDKTPKSAMGRVVAIIWMFSGLIFLGFFTASITTALTVERLEGSIGGPEDLPGRRVATVTGTTAAEYLYDQGAIVVEFDTFDEACEALLQDRVVAVVYDSPALRYFSSHGGAGRTQTAGSMFMEQSYGIALPEGSELREPISRVLLELRENGSYGNLYADYFGSEN